jgi:hypothetical protein
MAVATARLCPEASVRRELDHVGMLRYFDDVLSNARVAARPGWKDADSASKRVIIEEAAASLGLPVAQTAFIGDWVVDIRSAKEAGCALTIGVLSSGFRPGILEAENPDAILGSAAELPDYLATIPDLIGPGYLAIDREGRWLNDGVEITHPRTLESFWRGFERNGRGRYVVRLGRDECPVHVQAAPYFVRRVDIEGGRVTLGLSDGSSEPLDPATLRLVEGRFLHCRVKRGAHEARFGRGAYYEIAERIEESPGGGFHLVIGDRRYPIAV